MKLEPRHGRGRYHMHAQADKDAYRRKPGADWVIILVTIAVVGLLGWLFVWVFAADFAGGGGDTVNWLLGTIAALAFAILFFLVQDFVRERDERTEALGQPEYRPAVRYPDCPKPKVNQGRTDAIVIDGATDYRCVRT